MCEVPKEELFVASKSTPGLGRVDAKPDEMLSAPVAPPLPPVEDRTELASKYTSTTTVYPAPPPEFFPMVVYRTPRDYDATTLGPLPEKLDWPVELPSLLQKTGQMPEEEGQKAQKRLLRAPHK